MIVVKVISHPCPRITVMNTTYARGGARDLLLEYVSWSMNCLSFLIPRFMGFSWNNIKNRSVHVSWEDIDQIDNWGLHPIFHFLPHRPIWGDGHHPSYDPFGRKFDERYHPELWKIAGTEIIPGFKAVLEGIQCDQDYARLIFGLQQFYTRKLCCHYCNAIAWTSRNVVPGEPNSPNDLYTNFGADENWGTLCWMIFLVTYFPIVKIVSGKWCSWESFPCDLHDVWGLWTRLRSCAFMGNLLCVGWLDSARIASWWGSIWGKHISHIQKLFETGPK